MYDEEYILLSWGIDDSKLLRSDCQLHSTDDNWTYPFKDLKKGYEQLKGIPNGGAMKKVVEREGFEFTGQHHRAISDAENLAKLFAKYLEDWDLY